MATTIQLPKHYVMIVHLIVCNCIIYHTATKTFIITQKTLNNLRGKFDGIEFVCYLIVIKRQLRQGVRVIAMNLHRSVVDFINGRRSITAIKDASVFSNYQQYR